MRKRANGAYVVEDTKNQVKLAASERARNGERACKTPNCHKTIQSRDGSGGGYCNTHAPKSLRMCKECSHPGCSKEKRSGYDGKCKQHVDPINEKYIAQKLSDKLSKAKKRAAMKK